MFQGDVATRNVQQAPFIIALKRGHKLTKWLIEEGWGQGWGIYFTASTYKAHLLYGNPHVFDKRFLPSNEEQLKLGNLLSGQEDPLWKMRRHFRAFSDVYLESENKIVDFRYYDPAVMKVYLLSCNDKELFNIGSPISHFYVEDYCKVDSLNCPHQLYHFHIFFKNKDPETSLALITKCETYCLNLITHQKEYLSQFPASKRDIVKDNCFFVIRKEQIQAFRNASYISILKNLAYNINISLPDKFSSVNYIYSLLIGCYNIYGIKNTNHEFIDVFFDKYLVSLGYNKDE